VLPNNTYLGQLKTAPQQALHFGGIRCGMLAADPFPRDVAGEFVQLKPNRQPLLSAHLPVPRNLAIQYPVRGHALR
jgi:hypothetical protein